jgi:excisionase family DNA binding protein
VREARKLTGLGNTTVYALIADGTLKTTKVRTRRLIYYDSIEKLVGRDRHCSKDLNSPSRPHEGRQRASCTAFGLCHCGAQRHEQGPPERIRFSRRPARHVIEHIDADANAKDEPRRPHHARIPQFNWAAELTDFPSEVVEMALAHLVGDKVEAAYRRSDLFEKRRRLMTAWGEYTRAPPAKQGKKAVALRSIRRGMISARIAR